MQLSTFFYLPNFISVDKKNLKDEDHIIITMFVSTEHGIRIHDIRPVELETKLLACIAPFIISVQKLSMVRDVMNDFIGLEKCDSTTSNAVLDFSYHLSLGEFQPGRRGGIRRCYTGLSPY